VVRNDFRNLEKKDMSTNQILVLAVLGLSLMPLAACGGEPAETSARPDRPAVSAVSERVENVTIDDVYEAVGTVRSRTTTVLSSKVMGQILAVKAQQGDQVRAGQLLVEIDNRDADANLARARGGLSEAESALAEVEESWRGAEAGQAAADAGAGLAASTFRRYQALLERKSVSPQEFEEIEFKHKAAQAEARRADQGLLTLAARKQQVLARIEQAKAELRNAETHLSYASVTAPHGGVVTTRYAEAGALSTPGLPLLTLEDSRNYQLEAMVEESRIGRVKPGDRVAVVIDALGGSEIAGQVAEIVPGGDPGSRSFVVKVRLPGTEGIRSGMFGRARFGADQKQALTVPASALFERGQLVAVYVVDEKDTARLRLVKTGKRHADRVEILSGLRPGERIVVEHPERLQDGTPVQSAG
jgi:multidrug efflux pump subunit AcrA (membrane-fusion protein)